MTQEEKGPEGNTSENTLEDQDLSLEESQDKSPSNSQTGGQGSEEVELEEIEIQPAPGTPEYQHPLLRGKSPEEIERIVKTQEEAIRQQNEELNIYHDRLQSASSAPPPSKAEEEDEGDYGDDFLAPRFKRLEQKLSKQLEAAVKPLVDHTKKEGAQSVRGHLRSELKHFGRLEPHIDQMIRTQGGNPSEATEASLRFYYYAALGLADERGVKLDSASAPAPTAEEQPTNSSQPGQAPVGIPQHRPSSAPLPQPTNKSTPRPLTEAERRLAAQYFPIGKDGIKTAEEQHNAYRTWQDKEIDEVVEPGFSRENW